MIDHDWALHSYDSFYVFYEAQNIHGEKVKIAQRTENSVNQWKLMAEVIHDKLYNSEKKPSKMKLCNVRLRVILPFLRSRGSHQLMMCLRVFDKRR